MNADSITSISNGFKEKSVLSKSELLHWLHRVYPAASDKTLSWRISDLKSQGILESPGRGIFRLSKAKPFKPPFGTVTKRIASLLKRDLPLIRYCIWETRWVSSWMNLQPAAVWIILEVEKEMLESVFYRLKDCFKNVFLDPDRKTTTLYLLHLNEAIIIKPLLSESPTLTIGDIQTALPEKILVDLIAEPQLFQAQQGEIEEIFATAFQALPINQSKLLRYAARRRKRSEVEHLIPIKQRLQRTDK
ncbi:MAG: DUF6577 family protein [Saprospiraceae bacterium]